MFFLVRSKPCWDNLWLMLAGWVLFLAQPGIADDSCPVYLAGQETSYTIKFRSESGSRYVELRNSCLFGRQLNVPARIDSERRELLTRFFEEGFDKDVKELCLHPLPDKLDKLDKLDNEQRQYLKQIDESFQYNEKIKSLWDPQNFNFFKCVSDRARMLSKAIYKSKVVSNAPLAFYDSMVNAGKQQHLQLVLSRFECYREEQVLVFAATSEREWAFFPNGVHNVKGTPEAVLYEWELKINKLGEVIAANLIYPGLSGQSLLTGFSGQSLLKCIPIDSIGFTCCASGGFGVSALFLSSMVVLSQFSSEWMIATKVFGGFVCCITALTGGGAVSGLNEIYDKKTRVINSIDLTSAPQEKSTIVKTQPFIRIGSDISRRNQFK